MHELQQLFGFITTESSLFIHWYIGLPWYGWLIVLFFSLFFIVLFYEFFMSTFRGYSIPNINLFEGESQKDIKMIDRSNFWSSINIVHLLAYVTSYPFRKFFGTRRIFDDIHALCWIIVALVVSMFFPFIILKVIAGAIAAMLILIYPLTAFADGKASAARDYFVILSITVLVQGMALSRAQFAPDLPVSWFGEAVDPNMWFYILALFLLYMTLARVLVNWLKYRKFSKDAKAYLHHAYDQKLLPYTKDDKANKQFLKVLKTKQTIKDIELLLAEFTDDDETKSVDQDKQQQAQVSQGNPINQTNVPVANKPVNEVAAQAHFDHNHPLYQALSDMQFKAVTIVHLMTVVDHVQLENAITLANNSAGISNKKVFILSQVGESL